MKQNFLRTILSLGLLLASVQVHAQSYGDYFSGFGLGDIGGSILSSRVPVGYSPLVSSAATGVYGMATSPSGQFDYGGLGMGLAVGATAYTIDTIGLGIAGYSLGTVGSIIGGPVSALVTAGTAGYTLYNSQMATNFDNLAYWSTNVYNAMGDLSSGSYAPSYSSYSTPSFSSVSFGSGSSVGYSSDFVPGYTPYDFTPDYSGYDFSGG